MSEQSLPEHETEMSPVDELSMLRERAKMMGIRVPPKIGIETLKKKIQDRLDGVTSKENDMEEEVQPKKERAKTKAETDQEIRERLWKEQLALVRCRIYNLDPSKRDLKGEIITVANRYIGTVRKFIPFGEATDNGYHIPKIIYEDLKSRKFQQVSTRQKNGQIEVSTRFVPEYNIEVLPPLTKEEIQELALKQAAAQRLGE